MITSTQNPKIRWVKKLLTEKKERQESGWYVMEGIRLSEEALQREIPIQFALYSSPLTNRIENFTKALQKAGIEAEEVPPQLMRSISDTTTPQGILIVVKSQPLPIHSDPDFVLVLDGIHDPGNLGTMFRTAAAAAVDLMCLAPGCADPYSPKAVRSGMGAHLKIPFFQYSWQEIDEFFQAHPRIIPLASDMEGGKSLWAEDFCRPIAIIIGSEAEGICKEAERLAKGKVFIPMSPDTESMNAAVASGILMFEVVRQRSLKLKTGR